MHSYRSSYGYMVNSDLVNTPIGDNFNQELVQVFDGENVLNHSQILLPGFPINSYMMNIDSMTPERPLSLPCFNSPSINTAGILILNEEFSQLPISQNQTNMLYYVYDANIPELVNVNLQQEQYMQLSSNNTFNDMDYCQENIPLDTLDIFRYYSKNSNENSIQIPMTLMNTSPQMEYMNLMSYCNNININESATPKLRGKKNKKMKEYPCPHPGCQLVIKRKDDLTRHMRTHSGEKPFTCLACNKRFSRKDHLKSHERTHTKERPYKCENCGRAFARSDERKRHSKTHLKDKRRRINTLEKKPLCISSPQHENNILEIPQL